VIFGLASVARSFIFGLGERIGDEAPIENSQKTERREAT